jgi:galactoside O-acetyltransferase
MRRILSRLIVRFYQRWRIFVMSSLSDKKVVTEGKPKLYQPVVLKGHGKIIFKGEVVLGYPISWDVFSGTGYMEARNEDAIIEVGDNTYINNSFNIVADHGRITIGKKNRIGVNVTILNSDFHNLDPKKRDEGSQSYADIIIKDNVFIGNNVIITKGVTIGENSVVGAGAVVVADVPPNTICAGNPAKIIRKL